MEIKGDIIAGEFDQVNDAFILQQVKHLSTSSILNKDQFNAIYEYLNKHKQEADGNILTLNEQILVHLSQEESNLFLEDLDNLRPLFR